jgi:hypothetical protein
MDARPIELNVETAARGIRATEISTREDIDCIRAESARRLFANETAGALISMMTQSTTRSNQRPDTLMQGQSPQIDENLLRRTAGPYIRVKGCLSKDVGITAGLPQNSCRLTATPKSAKPGHVLPSPGPFSFDRIRIRAKNPHAVEPLARFSTLTAPPAPDFRFSHLSIFGVSAGGAIASRPSTALRTPRCSGDASPES